MSGSYIRQVEVFIANGASPEAAARALAKAAKEGTAELIASGRAPPRFTRYVDGKRDAAAESVKPGGVIVDVFDRMADVISLALGYLRQRAPTGGGFRESFLLGLDGKMVRAAQFNPRTLGVVSEVYITNAEPWNRLVDVQMAGGKPVRFSVPAEMYLDCAKAISRRFGNSVSADREYNIDFPGKYRLLTGPRQGKPVQSPGLVIRARR